jgi:hypothetical protein
MLRCNKYYCHPQGEIMTIDFESLKERLREMFPNQYKNEVDQYIESKNPKNAAEVEYWLQQFTYHNRHGGFGA